MTATPPSPSRVGRIVPLALALGLALAAGRGGARADSITLGGRTIDNAEMAGVAEGGVQYQTADGVVVVPWSELSQFQRSAVQSRFAEALDNLRLRAVWVEGTVFERTNDGVVVQTSLDLKAPAATPGEAEAPEAKPAKPAEAAEAKPKVTEWKNGGEVAKGLVIVKDLKDSAIKMPGDPVAGIFYKIGTFTYEVGGFNLIKEIPLLSQTMPEWAAEREWTNLEGKKIRARLRAVKEGKCLLEQGGKGYPYPIDQLSEKDRSLIAEFEKRVRQIPL